MWDQISTRNLSVWEKHTISPRSSANTLNHCKSFDYNFKYVLLKTICLITHKKLIWEKKNKAFSAKKNLKWKLYLLGGGEREKNRKERNYWSKLLSTWVSKFFKLGGSRNSVGSLAKWWSLYWFKYFVYLKKISKMFQIKLQDSRQDFKERIGVTKKKIHEF